jgi:autotransporter-associated beta strand protein
MSSPINSHRTPHPLALGAACLLALLVVLPHAHAATYYWDSNDSTAGFGTAQGTWAAPTTNDATQGWSLSSAGTNVMSGSNTTTTSDTLWFGSSTANLSTGTITVSGNVNSGAMNFGSASGNITLSGGNITLNGNITPNAATAATHTITSNISLSGNRQIGVHQQTNKFIFTGVISGAAGLTYSSSSSGILTLSGMNTFTGNFAFQRGQLNFNSIADAGQNNALGAGSTITLGLNGAQPTTFWYTGTSSASSNRTWSNPSANAITFVSQNGSLQLTGDINSTNTSNVAVNLTGTADTGINEISGNISDAAGAGVTSIAVNNTAPSGGSGEAGFWILSGNNSHEGTTTVNTDSRLRIAHSNALGTTAAGTSVVSGSVLELTGGISVGAEALALNGSGISSGGAMRNISGANSYAGVITLGSTSSINSDADTLTLSGGITGTNRNLTIGGAGDTTISGNITTGTGTLTKDGAGTLTISSTGNTYNGTTTISQGTLLVTGNTSTSAHIVSSGAVLGGTGVVGATTVNGTLEGSLTTAGLTINNGGIVSPNGTGSVGTINTSSLTINGGRYDCTINSATGSAGSDWDQITSTGALTSSGLLTVYAYGTPGDWDGSASYSWDIISANSMTGFSTNNFALDLTNFLIPAGNRVGDWSFSNPSGGIIRLSYTPSGDPVWLGGTGNFSTGFTPAASNGDDIAFSGAGGTATNDDELTSVNDLTFNSGTGAYTIAGAALTVNGSILNSSTSTQTINTDLNFAATRVVNASAGDIEIGGVVSGSGGLTKDGLNSLTLSANNNYDGGTTINAGTVVMGHANGLGTSGNISFTGGGLKYATGITTDISSRIKNSSSAILFDTTDNDVTFSAALDSTNVGGLTKDGVGTLTLNGSNTFSGTITIAAGTLGIGSAGRLAGGSYSGNIAINGLTSTFVYSGTSNQTLSGVISGNGVLTKNGGATLTISGASKSITGNVTINGGTVSVGGGALNTNITVNSGATLINDGNNKVAQGASNTLTLNGGTLDVGTFLSEPGAIVMNNGTINGNSLGHVLAQNGWTGTGTNTINQRVSLENLKSGSGLFDIQSGTTTINAIVYNYDNRTLGITKNGTGTLLLNGNNTFGGTTTINAGTLEIGGSGRLGGGTFSSNITNNANLIYSGTNAQTLSGVISGTGNLTQNASSTLTLSNSATNYSGLTTITAGTLAISNNMTIGAITGSGNLSLGNGFTLTTNSASNSTFSGVISGSGALAKNGGSTLTLGANNTYSGDTTINAGTVEINTTGLLGGGSYSGNIVNNGAFLIGSNSNQTLSGAISGTGALTKNGTGALILTGSNNYSGGTTINAGMLVIGNTAAAGSGTITQTSSSSLLKFDTTGTIANAMSIYNVSANKTVTLSGGITVNNATFDVASGETLTISNTINGTGGVTKNGTGTLVLSGNNTYSAPTVINSGTLNATSAGAFGSNNTVQVNGGTLLVTADDAINGKNIELGGSGIGLQFSGNYSGAIGNLTLSANSIIDLGSGSVQILFQGLNSSNHTLSFYNWSGTTLWNGGNGTTDTDKVYFGPDLSDEALAKIYFYSGPGDSFLGSGFELMPQTTFEGNLGYQIIPVPEPETYATGLLLVLGGAWWMWKRNRNTCQRALSG